MDSELPNARLVTAIVWNQRRLDTPNPETLPPKLNVLLAGPTGCGKTALVQAAAEISGLPFVSVNASALTMPGLKGTQIEDVILQLYEVSGRKLRGALVHLDEIDKLKFVPDTGQSHNTLTTQQLLLTLLEGGKVVVQNNLAVSTHGITFVASGAFANRFTRDRSRIPTKRLIDFGLIPEFIARFPLRCSLGRISDAQLRDILLSSDNSPLRKLVDLYRRADLELHIDDDVVSALIDAAHHSRTGARALYEQLASRFPYLLTDLEEYRERDLLRVVVTRECLRGATSIADPEKQEASNLNDVDFKTPVRVRETPRVDPVTPNDALNLGNTFKVIRTLSETHRSKVTLLSYLTTQHLQFVGKHRHDVTAGRLEAINLLRFRSPKILQLEDFHTQDNRIDLILRLASGGDVTSAQHRGMSSMALLTGILEGLSVIHQQGSLLGNLRPAHVLIHENQVVLTGLAYALDGIEHPRELTELAAGEEGLYRAEPDVSIYDVHAELFVAAQVAIQHFGGFGGVPPSKIAIHDKLVRHQGIEFHTDELFVEMVWRLLNPNRRKDTPSTARLAKQCRAALEQDRSM